MSLVRAFMPQQNPGLLTTNTNYPPQRFDESGGIPESGFEGIGGTTDNIIWDDSVDSGNLEFIE